MTDIIIIGAGPAGLSAAVAARRRGKSVRLISAGEPLLARAERIDNYLGLPGKTGGEIMDVFREHAAAEGVTAERAFIQNILPVNGKIMVDISGEIAEARAVVLALGGARPKPVPGEEALLGRGVSYCATCDGMLYRGRKAVVAGARENVAEECNFLASVGVSVTYVGAKRPAGLAETVAFEQGGVTGAIGADKLSEVAVGKKRLAADVLFLLRPSVEPARLAAGLEVREGFISVDRRMATNLPGIYAAGDCTGGPWQISKAVGEGLIAAESAAEDIEREEKNAKA